MTTAAIFVMIVILGIVWGGFILTLGIAMKQENKKMKASS